MSQSLPEQSRLVGLGLARPRLRRPDVTAAAAGLVSAFQRMGEGAAGWLRSGEFKAFRPPEPGLCGPPRRAPADPARPTVSVIVPCRDGAATLPATLRSLRRQTFKGWEAVVVDDGSVDQTAAVARRWAGRDRRIRLVQETGRGVGAARNAGLAAARGEWVLFLDCDDWLARGALAHLLSLARRRPNAGVVKGRAIKVDPDGRRRALPAFDLSEPFAALCCEGRIAIHTAIVRRDLVERIGGFDPALKTSEDWDVWQRLARMGVEFAQSPRRLAFYRNSPESLSKRTLQVATDGLTVLRRGHGADARVAQPAPAFAMGGPADALPARELYFVLWCAARAVATGDDGVAVAELLGSPGANAEPRSLGELMASGMADVLGAEERALGHRWPEFEPKLARLLAVLGPHQARVQALTLAVIKARLNAGAPSEADRLELEAPQAQAGEIFAPTGALQLARRGRTIGALAVPFLAPREPSSLAEAVVAQAGRLPLRLALGASRCWTSADFWVAALARVATRLRRPARLSPGYGKAVLRAALTHGLEASLAARLPRGRPAEADAHQQALAALLDAAAAEARGLAADLGPSPRPPARPGPSPRFAPGSGLALPVLMYHRIARDAAPGLERYCLAPDQFEAQLAHLRREGYASVTPEQLLRFLRFEAGLPPRSVMLTFDDGYEDFAGEAWPLLRRYGFQAVVFAVTGKAGEVADWDAEHGAPAPLMDWRSLRELAADGVAIESHGHAHRALSNLPIEDVYREATRSRAVLQQVIGVQPLAFCYPFGAHDPASERALEECGYGLALTTQSGRCALGASPLRIPRIEVAGGDDLETFARKLRARG